MFRSNCTRYDFTTNTTNGTCISWSVSACAAEAERFQGLLDTLFMFAYAIGLYVSGRLGDSFDLRGVLASGMFLAASTVGIFGTTVYFRLFNPYFYGALWVLNGLFQSVGWPSAVAVMGNWFGHSQRGFIFGAWSACASVGNIIGAFIASEVIEYGWGWCLIGPAAALFAGGIAVLTLLPVHPSDVGLMSPQDAAAMSTGVENAEDKPLLQVQTNGGGVGVAGVGLGNCKYRYGTSVLWNCGRQELCIG
eukprot:UC1_evm1s549